MLHYLFLPKYKVGPVAALAAMPSTAQKDEMLVPIFAFVCQWVLLHPCLC